MAAECAEADRAEDAAALAAKLDLEALVVPVGATPYALGAVEIARDEAARAAQRIGGAELIVADGPQTLWMLQRVWQELGIEVTTEVRSLPAHVVAEAAAAGPHEVGQAYLADSRAAAYLADGLALPVTIQPGYLGADADESGRGAVYDDLRAALRHLGGTEQRHRWERSLARSTGADDGLWATYPDIAAELAATYLRQAAAAGARLVVTDSPLAAAVLARAEGEPSVAWIGDLV
jgi:hypothetical protein